MIYLLRKPFSPSTLVSLALTHFYGIGKSTALTLCQELLIAPALTMGQLRASDLYKLSKKLNSMVIDSELKTQEQKHLNVLKQIHTSTGRP